MASLKFLTPNIVRTLQRFPLSVICSIALFFLGVYHNDRFEDLTPFTTFFFCGFFVFGLARLAAEAQGWNLVKEGLAGVIGTSFFFFIVNFYGVTAGPVVIAIFLLGVLTIPFLGRKTDDLSYWYYQQQISTGFCLAFIAAVIFLGGILIALTSIQFLFEVQIPSQAYLYVWLFCTLVYAPFNMLSWVPEKFEAQPGECHAAPGLPFILNWILAPLAFLYFLILYAYGAKILFEWELPRGMIVYMVSGFGGLGILIYISGWIMKDTGTPLLKYMYKHYFSLLILPVILLFVAIYVRIDQYGLTQDRYLVVLLGVWMGAMALLYTFRPQTPLKTILATLMVMLFLSSFGPWGAVSLSETSQISRLKDVLARNNMLENGVAVAAKTPLTFNDQEALSSILDYLSDNRRGQKVSEIIPAIGKQKRFQVSEVMTKLNVRYLSHYERRREGAAPAEKLPFTLISFYAKQDHPVFYKVKGYDSLYTNVRANTDGGDSGNKYRAMLKDNHLTLDWNGRVLVLATPEKLLEIAKLPKESPPFTLEGLDGDFHVKYVVRQATFKDYGSGDIRAQSINGDLLMKE